MLTRRHSVPFLNPRTVLAGLVIVAALGVLTAPLSAKVLKYFSRNGNFTFTGGPVAVPLNDDDDTVVSFNKAGSGQKLHAIIFSAECSVGGAGNIWINLAILVDGVEVAPTTEGDAFCSGNGTDSRNDGWTTASRTVAVKVGPGAHNVSVTAEVQGSSPTGGWIGDSTLTIIN